MFIFIDFLFYSSVSFGLFLCGVCVWCGLVEHTSFFFFEQNNHSKYRNKPTKHQIFKLPLQKYFN